MKKLMLIGLVAILTGVGGYSVYRKQQDAKITTFAACAAAGNPIMTSYPGQCRTRDGRLFVENIGNELELHDEILISTPRPNAEVSSPLLISGQARGPWYFEASFPAELIDANGNQLGTVVVHAEGDWMTGEFVPFTATLTFTKSTTATGILKLYNANSSGLPENSKSLVVPLLFTN